MKNKKYIIASLISLSTLCSSCNDWLDLVPQDTQTSEQYWKTGKEVENVLASGYYYLRNSWQTLFFWSEARGIGLGALGNNDGAAQWDKLSIFDILPTDEYVKWEKMYKIISMANAVITYGPEVCDKDESFTENHALSLNAEAYFLRSYAYFTLVRNYREVPLILESFVTDETPFVKAKSTESEILTQLIKDLEGCMEYAKEYFPEIDADSKMNTKGRATRWAVKALLADIYLWRGESGNNGGKSDYERCIELCDEIIESGRIGLISGQRWFENFYPGNSNESIFEIQYDYNLSQTNSFLTIFNVNKSFTLNYNTILSFSS